MKRTLSRTVLAFLFLGVTSAVYPLMSFAQTCTSQPVKAGRTCTKVGALCSPVTEGIGNKGKCTTEGSPADVLTCECKGLPTPTYTFTLVPLTPPSITTPSGGVATSTITVIPFNGFTGSVRFTCTVTGGSPPLPSCPNPSPATVTTGPATSALSVSTDSSTSSATYTITVTGTDAGGAPPGGGPQSVTLQVEHKYGIGAGGGGIALLTLAGLLALWSMGRLWRGKRADLQ
jgi:hypothetical protein